MLILHFYDFLREFSLYKCLILLETQQRDYREMTKTQKSPSEPKIFDFSCISQNIVVPLQAKNVINRAP